MLRVGALLLVAIAAGCGDSRPRPAVEPIPPRVSVVRADSTRAARVSLRGATAAERHALRASLARLGSLSPVTEVVVDNRAPDGGRQIVASVHSPEGSLPRRVQDFESQCLATLAIADATGTLERQDIGIDWARVRGVGFAEIRPNPADPPRSERELRRLSEQIAARGKAAGLDVREVTALRVAGGAVRIVVDLSTRQILTNSNATWLTALVPDRFRARPPYAALLLVLAPNGVPVAYGANWEASSGGWSYGSSSTVRGRRSPPLPHGPARLDITIERVFNRTSPLRFHLDCEGRPRGVADAEAACRRLEREWLAFLPPVATDTVCAGGLTDQMTIRGTIGGVKVSRDYSNCYAEMTLS